MIPARININLITQEVLMKATLLTLSLLFSVAAIAGPEDHIYDSCYTAVGSVLRDVPSTFCFEDAKLDVYGKRVDFSGYASNIPSTFKTQTVFQKNSQSYSFVASAVVVNIWETGCGEGQYGELIITGEADLQGKVNPKTLLMSLNYSLRSDTCHSSPSTGATEYKLSK